MSTMSAMPTVPAMSTVSTMPTMSFAITSRVRRSVLIVETCRTYRRRSHRELVSTTSVGLTTGSLVVARESSANHLLEKRGVRAGRGRCEAHLRERGGVRARSSAAFSRLCARDHASSQQTAQREYRLRGAGSACRGAQRSRALSNSHTHAQNGELSRGAVSTTTAGDSGAQRVRSAASRPSC